MSAFIVTDKTMQVVVNAIDHYHDREGIWCNMLVRNSHHLDMIGQELFKLNANAVSQRYRGEEQHVPGFVYKNRTFTDLERYRAVACLVYQCSEGNVPDTEMYQALVRIENIYAGRIADDLARKANVPWNFPED